MYIIAEIGQAHEGSLGIAHSYIDAVAATGVNAVKFQTHIAAAESSEFEPFRVKFSYEDDTRFDYWKRMEFTPEQWSGLKRHCEDKGLEFLSSPFSVAAVELLEKLGVNKYKIGSGEVNNYLMLQRIAETGKDILLSSGMSSFTELDESIRFLSAYPGKLSVLQCTTSYPTAPADWGLHVIPELKSRYNLPTGFSDHSGDIYACLAATALGAEILEFHVVFDKQMFGPDAKASLTLLETIKLVEGVKAIEIALGNKADKDDNSRFAPLKQMFGKSLALNRDMKAGEAIAISDLESKKPGDRGIPARDYQSVLGKILKKDKSQWEFLEESDLQ